METWPIALPAPAMDDYSWSEEPRVRMARFDDGFEQRTVDGINNQPRTFELQWPCLSTADKDIARSFLIARGGTEAFYWTPIGETQILVSCGEWKIEHHSGLLWKLKVTFEEEYSSFFLGEDVPAPGESELEYAARFIISFADGVPYFEESNTYSDVNIEVSFTVHDVDPVLLATASLDIEFSTIINSISNPSPGYGIDDWVYISVGEWWFGAPGGIASLPLYSYKYDTVAKTFTIDVYAELLAENFSMILYGEESTVAAEDTIDYTVTQTFWGGSPVALSEVSDSGRYSFTGGGIPSVERDKQFQMIAS